MVRHHSCTPIRILCLTIVSGVLWLGVADSLAQEAIIIDHKCTKVQTIPPYWIEQAKLLTIHYAHTSHGSQVNSGAQKLEDIDSYYSFARRAGDTEGLPPVEDPPAIRMYDGNPPETYIEPGDYWDGDGGKNRTRAVAGTGSYDFSMWSWCGQQSWNSYETTQRYLNTMAEFEREYPGMRFILMTGHTDGNGEDGNLHARNNQVRDFASDNGMVLFDFADIESYNPDWAYFLDRGCDDYGNYDGGNWPAEWCAAHPGDDLCVSCSCAHSQSLICNLKGRAFWWMMARLAGWSGPPAADQNRDGDVDHDDFALLAECLGGPGVTTPPGTCSAEAFDQADIDGDGDVDMADFATFSRCLAGPDSPPNCP